ncbi:conserved membrane hypothetical protein [[Clostridium] ultunense Esp]|nr:conserved membrane hypothetical protein [[Clostridium] ultunense Esp]
MADWLENPYIAAIAYYSVAGLAIILFLTVFEVMTRYHTWQEIKRGNLAVALAVAGKIFGISNILHFSILHHDTLGKSLLWGGMGSALLLLAYLIFEFLTPQFRVDQELEQGNLAVGFLSMVISVSFSYIIGASISY